MKPLRHEPAGSIGTTVSGVLFALWFILKGAGYEPTEDLRTGVETLIYVLLAVPAISGWLTRFFVVSPETAAKAVIRAKNDYTAAPAVPEIKVVGGAYEAAVEDRQFSVKPPPVNP
jgi:hypothetical protein